MNRVVLAVLTAASLTTSAPAAATDWRVARLDAAAWPKEILPDPRPNAGAGFVDGLLETYAGAGGDIAKAWYVAPTRRYRHGVIGDDIEAGGLRVETTSGATLTFSLPRSEVFEDRTPRLADLDGDGRVEVVAIVASQSGGAAMAVFGVVAGKLSERARTPHIGTPNRWLNIAGIADFLGTGDKQVAYVQTPHIGGTLFLWRFQNGRLTRVARKYGFSNHAIGARELRLSGVADIDGDGRAELALPSANRRALRIVEISGGGAWREIATLDLPARVTKAIAVVGSGPETRFVLGLAGGRVVEARR